MSASGPTAEGSKRDSLLALSGGCQQRTELMIGLITDIAAPAPLDIAHLQVFPNGDTTQTPKIDTFWMLEPGFDKLPGSFGLISSAFR